MFIITISCTSEINVFLNVVINAQNRLFICFDCCAALINVSVFILYDILLVLLISNRKNLSRQSPFACFIAPEFGVVFAPNRSAILCSSFFASCFLVFPMLNFCFAISYIPLVHTRTYNLTQVILIVLFLF